MTESTITRAFYEAFQRVKFDRWDTIIAQDVLINSPAGLGIRGLQTFKDFAVQFTDLGYRIDLIDEHLALDESGTGRGFITFCLNWKHTNDFGGLAPTGREGTSVETCLLTIVEHKITRIDVADNTLDFGIYEWQRGWPIPHNIQPEPIVTGSTAAPRPQRRNRTPDDPRDAASTLGHDGQALRGGTLAEYPTWARGRASVIAG